MPNIDSLDAYVDATHYTLGKLYRPEDMHIGNRSGCSSSCASTRVRVPVHRQHQ
jgi:hypothetical protein